jgi:choline-sulfatase
VVTWPGTLPAGHHITTPLGGVDLAPTLLEWAGLSYEDPIDGRSVAADVAAGRQPDPVPVFSEVGTSAGINFRSTEPEELAARIMVRDGDFKLNWNRTDVDELYDLAGDPDERVNLAQAPEQADRVAHLRSLVCQMLPHTGPGYYDWCL